MPVLHYYTRKGCHLCEIMLEELLPLLRGKVEVEVRDVDTVPQWLDQYNLRVPVLEAGGRLLSEYPLNYRAISAYLAELTENGDETGA